MNKKKFEKEVSELNRSKMNLSFQTEWYSKVLEELDILAKQKAAMKHPRHRGDAREDDLINHLKKICPIGVGLAKGFVVCNYGFTSREQDCLLINNNTAATIVPNETVRYIPLDAALGSIEIKSNLDLIELRKAIINIASVKKLLYEGDFDFSKPPKIGKNFLSTIFAYSSPYNLNQLTKKLNELNENIPPSLRVNAVYLLKKGVIIISEQDSFSFRHEDLISGKGKYVPFERIGKQPDERSFAVPFLVFQAAIIDHALHEMKNRELPIYRNQVLLPIMWFDKIKDHIEKSISPQEARKILSKL